jgi:hypothetical protein
MVDASSEKQSSGVVLRSLFTSHLSMIIWLDEREQRHPRMIPAGKWNAGNQLEVLLSAILGRFFPF